MASERPRVLCISGHDPGGGAGIQADIEAVGALGGHAVTVVSAHTVQDTRDVARVVAADPALMREQIDALLDDAPVRAIKIGLLGGEAQLPVIAAAIARAQVPVVLDPVLRAGGGAALPAARWMQALAAQLLPHVDVLTPNAAEARALAGVDDLDDAGARLLALGARHVLVTGGDEPGDVVVNRWHAPGRPARRFAWPRLGSAPGAAGGATHGFHGAGCTLAAAIAALLARGAAVADALFDAQAYTQRSLAHAFASGRGRRLPGRVAPAP